jgi:uncharacterized membrane protein YoaK (UPF0700 family)
MSRDSSFHHDRAYINLLGLQDGSADCDNQSISSSTIYTISPINLRALENETMLSVHPYIAVFILSFVGGFVDSAIFISLFGLFTASVTGNLISIVAIGERERISRFTVTATFFTGAAFSSIISNIAVACGAKKQKTIAALLLSIEVIILLSLALAGHIFKDQIKTLTGVDQPLSLALGVVASFAMGIQNGLCRECFSSFPQTTVLTSTLVAEAQNIADFIFQQKEKAKSQSRCLFNLCPLVAFLSGAVVASYLINTEAGYLVLLLPAFLIAILAIDVSLVSAFEIERNSNN